MALRHRAAISSGAPDGGSEWTELGETFNLAGATATTTAAAVNVQVTPAVSKVLAGGVPVADALLPWQFLARLEAAQFVASALVALAANLTAGLQVVRQIPGGLATQINNAATVTSIPLVTPIASPLVSGQTVTMTNASGNTQTFTLNAAAPVGASALSVNSVAANATYPVGSVITYLVGNAIAFGWLQSAGGTPVFPANAAVMMPANAANTAVTVNPSGSYLNLLSGDVIQWFTQTSSTTAVVPSALLFIDVV